MRDAKLAIAPDARAALVSLIGGDRQASRSEIRKLALYAHGKDRVVLDDVIAVVTDASALALDDVVDAAFAGRTARHRSAILQGAGRRHLVRHDPVVGAALRHPASQGAARARRRRRQLRRDAKLHPAGPFPPHRRGRGRAAELDRAAAAARHGAARRHASQHAAHHRAGGCAGATRAAVARRLAPAARSAECAAPLQDTCGRCSRHATPNRMSGDRHADRTLCHARVALLLALSRRPPSRRRPTRPRPSSSWCRSAPAARPIVAARVVAQVVQSGLGQNVVIENRPGAGGATGTKSVAAARAGRLHHADRHQRDARRGAGAGEEPRLRSGEKLRAGRQDFRQHHHPGRADRTSRPTRLPSSSPTPRPTRASSATRRPATATRPSSPPNCCWRAPASRPSMCPTRAAPRWSPRC